MSEPGVPGSSSQELDLPCGETVSTHDIDLGVREMACSCGESHAVVMDVHPLGRFVPEFLVDVLRETVETDDEFEEFKTVHMLAMVREEFPEQVVSADCSEDGQVGYSLVWLSDFDSRRLHEIVVELLVELMEHAVSHVEDDTAVSEFEQRMSEFDVDAFVEQYRQERDLETEHDTAI
ncbi:MAG: hypothetical protein ACI8XM_002378 [Haloarculaceae archaeon]|jgi:hypothetical protein